MIRILPWLLFCLGLLSVLYLFARLLNAGVTLDNARSQAARLRERNELALSIVRNEFLGKEEARVASLASELERQGLIVKKVKDGSFEIGDIIFEMKDSVVTQVRYFD